MLRMQSNVAVALPDGRSTCLWGAAKQEKLYRLQCAVVADEVQTLLA
jgi:hypothetical protein